MAAFFIYSDPWWSITLNTRCTTISTTIRVSRYKSSSIYLSAFYIQ